MSVLEVVIGVYVAGLLVFVGIATQSKISGMSEVIALLLWPVSIPAFALLRVWQHGHGRHRRFRYMDTKWYQRGETRTRNHGQTWQEWQDDLP
jgi:hypothetical protein